MDSETSEQAVFANVLQLNFSWTGAENSHNQQQNIQAFIQRYGRI